MNLINKLKFKKLFLYIPIIIFFIFILFNINLNTIKAEPIELTTVHNITYYLYDKDYKHDNEHYLFYLIAVKGDTYYLQCIEANEIYKVYKVYYQYTQDKDENEILNRPKSRWLTYKPNSPVGLTIEFIKNIEEEQRYNIISNNNIDTYTEDKDDNIKEINNIKFILYTGKWPILCHGILILEFNKEINYFGDSYAIKDFLKYYNYIKNKIDLNQEIVFQERLYKKEYIDNTYNNYYIEYLNNLVNQNKLIKNKNLFDRFWEPGGSITEDYEVIKDKWIINYEDLNNKYKKYYKTIDILFNNNVEYGCCGGCI